MSTLAMSQPNPVRARRERRTDDGWAYDPPEMTAGHLELGAVREAAGIAARAVAEGERLGGGNFGVAYRVETSRGPVVVKLPAATNIHGQPWNRAQQRDNLMHEAGVANELQELGVNLVPTTVYVELEDGTPALVREYGEPVTSLSVEEFGALELALTRLELEHDWEIHDYLSVYRRRDGTLYIGDVGIWRKATTPWAQRRWSERDSELRTLIPRFAVEVLGEPFSGMPPYGKGALPTYRDLLDGAGRLRRFVEDYRPEGLSKRHLRNQLRTWRDALMSSGVRRVQLGLPVPAHEVAEAIALYDTAEASAQ